MNNLVLSGNIAAPDSKKAIMSTQIKVEDILNYSEIDRSVNRDLGYHRLPKIVSYLDDVDSQSGIFLPSLVYSFREDPTPFWDVEKSELTLPYDSKLIVLDGQHRIKGLDQYIKNSRVSEEKKQKILNSYMTVQIYFGLSLDDERKLFTDINTNAKRVSRSLITRFDNRDILNVLTRDLYNSSSTLKSKLTVEFEKSRIVRPNKKTFITSVRLKKFIKTLLFGEKGIGSRPPTLNKTEDSIVRENYDKLFSFFNKFFTVLGENMPQTPGNVKEYVLGHEPIQNAIALYLHESIIVENKEGIEWLESWEDDVEHLKHINWSVKNRMWKPFLIASRKGTEYEYLAFNDISSDSLELKQLIEEKIHT